MLDFTRCVFTVPYCKHATFNRKIKLNNIHTITYLYSSIPLKYCLATERNLSQDYFPKYPNPYIRVLTKQQCTLCCAKQQFVF